MSTHSVDLEGLSVLTAIHKFPIPLWSAVLASAFAGILAVWVYRLTLHPLAQYPGPKLAACSSLYFMYYIWTGYFPQHCETLFRKYKSKVVRVAPGQIVFNDPRSLKDIVGRGDTYRGNFALRVIGFAGTNVSNIRDPGEHRRKRRLMAPGFSNTALNAQEPGIVVPIVDNLVARISESDGTVNLTNYFDCATLDIIGALSFGANFGMLDKLDSHPFLHVLPSVLRYSVIAQCIPEVFRVLSYVNRYGPAWMTPKAFRGVVDFAGYHLNLRKQRDATEIDLGSRQDIISVIEAGNEKFKGKQGYTHLGKYEMLGEATNLVTGGGDTVATALTNTFWHLGQNPAVYKRLVSEIRSEFTTPDSLVSPKIAQKIPYLDAVLNESMRVSPVLPGPMWRHTDNPIPVAGYMVPAHTELGAMRYNIFRNPDVFHRADEFLPQRWMQRDGEFRDDDLEASQPFGLGPRTCIGRNIAWMELRLIVAKLLWHFDWEAVTREWNCPEYLVLYRGPMVMKAQRRSD
ncbi:cytochrome P450 [Aspergillus floccosus]